MITKTGKPMLFAKIEDMSAKQIEVIVFNNTLSKTSDCWEENRVIVVQGKMSLRGGESKMICDQAKLV